MADIGLLRQRARDALRQAFNDGELSQAIDEAVATNPSCDEAALERLQALRCRAAQGLLGSLRDGSLHRCIPPKGRGGSTEPVEVGGEDRSASEGGTASDVSGSVARQVVQNSLSLADWTRGGAGSSPMSSPGSPSLRQSDKEQLQEYVQQLQDNLQAEADEICPNGIGNDPSKENAPSAGEEARAAKSDVMEQQQQEQEELTRKEEEERVQREKLERQQQEEERAREEEKAKQEVSERLQKEEEERVQREELATRLKDEEEERIRQEETERLEREEKERLQKEEVERAKKEEADRVEQEEAQRKQKEEEERVKKEEADRLEREEEERLQNEEVERVKKEEADRVEREEAQRKQKEEEERVKKEEAERLEREEEERQRKEEEERMMKQESDRLEREEAERQQQEEEERAKKQEEDGHRKQQQEEEEEELASKAREESGASQTEQKEEEGARVRWEEDHKPKEAAERGAAGGEGEESKELRGSNEESFGDDDDDAEEDEDVNPVEFLRPVGGFSGEDLRKFARDSLIAAKEDQTLFHALEVMQTPREGEEEKKMGSVRSELPAELDGWAKHVLRTFADEHGSGWEPGMRRRDTKTITSLFGVPFIPRQKSLRLSVDQGQQGPVPKLNMSEVRMGYEWEEESSNPTASETWPSVAPSVYENADPGKKVPVPQLNLAGMPGMQHTATGGTTATSTSAVISEATMGQTSKTQPPMQLDRSASAPSTGPVDGRPQGRRGSLTTQPSEEWNSGQFRPSLSENSAVIQGCAGAGLRQLQGVARSFSASELHRPGDEPVPPQYFSFSQQPRPPLEVSGGAAWRGPVRMAVVAPMGADAGLRTVCTKVDAAGSVVFEPSSKQKKMAYVRLPPVKQGRKAQKQAGRLGASRTRSEGPLISHVHAHHHYHYHIHPKGGVRTVVESGVSQVVVSSH